MRFLGELVDGDDDLASYLQRVAGYACTGSVREHVLPFLFGPGGNGKGTLLETLAHALGDYAHAMPEGFLAEKRTEPHPTELARLRGARLAYCSETTAGSHWNEARLKTLTGGDTITARHMRQDFFTFEPTHTLVVMGNNQPQIRSVDDAIKRRIQLVPLTHQPPRPDPTLPEKLRREVDGILSWALAGAIAWCDGGVQPPEAVRERSAIYFDAQDPLGEWLEETCHTGPRWESAITPLHRSWAAWCESRGVRAMGRKGLGDELEKRGFWRTRVDAGRRHVGIATKE